MKAILEQLLSEAVTALKHSDVIPSDQAITIKIDAAKDKRHGDFATNLAMMLAKPCKCSPLMLAEKLVEALPEHTLLKHAEVAAPGFINFFMNQDKRASFILERVFEEGDAYGKSKFGHGKNVILEYVSANPTGPLHVGHGRGAAFGASLANLLMMAGFDVTREYYVNDAGRQMNILAVSVWLRYLALCNEPIVFPSNGYQGDYVIAIAESLYAEHGRDYVHAWYSIREQLPADAPEGDKEAHIDALIDAARLCLGDAGFNLFHQSALDAVLLDIKADLKDFGVVFENWFSERSLLDSGAIIEGINALKTAGHTFEDDGALWFRATDFGDEKDRVLVRANGQTTYFASDVAYHWDKYRRGFDTVMDVFGADHHGYVARLNAAVHGLGHDNDALKVFLVQFANLYRHGERVQMSTRSGSFVTLRELRDEVGCDAARFFYVMRKSEQHMDFDLDLAKSQSRDNPVYYIQYAHARICSVFRQLETRELTWDKSLGLKQAALLIDEHETDLLTQVARFPDVVLAAAKAGEPHQMAYYLRELANALHAYYNAISLLCEQEALRSARLVLLLAVRDVLSRGLSILGVSAPERM